MVLVLNGCANEEEGREPIDIVFDPCSPLQIRVESATASQRADIQSGLAQWEREAGAQLEVTSSPDGDTPVVPVILDRAPHAFHGHYADEDGVVYLNEDLRGTELSITMAHEIGHVFGLYHVPREEGASVMNPGNLVHTVQSIDVDALRELWGACDPAPFLP
ncbi:MAG: hypothetical protein ACO3JL_01990 [Myxococcota bacterium]